MRFHEYTKQQINEKITKKEVNDALKSKEIYVGGEFEFIADVLENYNGANMYKEMYDDAMRDYDNFREEWREYESERDDLYNKIREWEEKYEELDNETIPEKEGEISDKEEEIEDIKGLMSDNEELRKTATEDEISAIDDELEGQKEAIAELEGELENLEQELKTLEKERDDAEWEQGEAEREYESYESYNMPGPGEDYKRYFQELEEMGYSNGYNEYWFEDGELEEPPDPEYNGFGGGLDDEDAWREAVESELEPIIDREAPFDDYKVGGYHDNKQGIGDKYWRVEHDSSISGEGGVEIISPPLVISDFLSDCKDMFNFIRKNGSTNGATGFHVHMSIKGVSNLENKLDPVKLVLLTDEEYIWKFFEDRKASSYVTKMKEPLIKRGISREDIYKVVDRKKLQAFAMSGGHNDAINLSSWKEGHVEFRYMGGSDYHRKYSQVENMIGRFAHTLLAACSTTYKEDEYLTKLNRILTKLDLYKWRQVVYAYVEFIRMFEGVANREGKKSEYTKFIKYLKMQKDKIDKMIKSVGVKELSGDQLHGMRMSGNREEFERFADDYLSKDLVKFTKGVKWSRVSSEYRDFAVMLGAVDPSKERYVSKNI